MAKINNVSNLYVNNWSTMGGGILNKLQATIDNKMQNTT